MNAELSSTYGVPVDFAKRKRLLWQVAKALNDGDLAFAQIAALHLRLPDPPEDRADGSADPTDMVIRLARASLLKILWDETKHPRWPAGSADSAGGQFAPAGEVGSATAPQAASASGRSAASDVTADQQRTLHLRTDYVDRDGTVGATFFINPPSKLGGVVVQHVVSTDYQQGKVVKTWEGWEAWEISKDQIATNTGQADDEWSVPPKTNEPVIPTRRTTTTEARFYEGITLDDLQRTYGFSVGGSGFSGGLNSTKHDPHLPTDHATAPLVRSKSSVLWMAPRN